MALRTRIATGALALRRGPSGIEPIRGGHGQNADIAPIFAEHAGRGDGLIGHCTLISDDDRTVRPGPSEPVGAIDDTLPKIVVDSLRGLFEWLGCKPEIDRAAGLIAQPCPLVGIVVAVTLEIVEGPFHG